MKKIKLLGVTTLMGLFLVGCGNQQLFDTTYTFNYAQFSLPNGEIIEGKLSSWQDYDGEQLQLKMADGNTYLVSSFNAVLSVNEID